MSFAIGLGPYLAAAAAIGMPPLLFALNARHKRRLRRYIGPQFSHMARSLAPWRQALGWILWSLACALTVLAAAGPRIPGPRPTTHVGIDMVFVMDFSTSMLAADIRPNRLLQMERAVEDLLDVSVGNRVGVVVFAGAAAHVPLTHDHGTVRSLFRGLEVQDLPQGSNLGEALRVARCLARPGILDDPDCRGLGGRGRGGDPLSEVPGFGLPEAQARTERAQRARRLPERARTIIVFTDGEQPGGQPGDAGDAVRRELQLATGLGIEVYIVGVGTPQGALVPDLDPNGYAVGWKRLPDGTPVQSRLAIDRLLEWARLAGGDDRLFAIGLAGRPVSQLGSALEGLQRGVMEAQYQAGASVHYRDVYEWFLFPALLLLVIEAVLSRRRRTGESIASHMDP